jgi:branched-chain amino acid transport system ATP-binding protein
VEVLYTVNLVKKFGGLVALDGVSIKIRQGTLTLLIGPNGSGKTTFINVVTGVYKPDGGRVYIMGLDATGKKPHEVYKLGVARTFQIPQIQPKLTVLDNVILGVSGHPGESLLKAPFPKLWVGRERELSEKALKILDEVGLGHLWDRAAGGLSGGQLRLLEIARALFSGAKLIIMDEPAAGLNPVTAHEVFKRLTKIKERLGVTFLIVEHRLDIAAEYADYAYAMAYGRVVSEGPPQKVLTDPAVVEAYLGA